MANYIIWDFDGTLAHRPGRWSGALYEIFTQYCPERLVDIDEIQLLLRDGFPWHDYLSPHPEINGADEWWERMTPKFINVYEQLSCPPELSRMLASKVRDVYTDVTYWRRYEDTLPVLESLRQRKWVHVILSNHVPELPRIAQHLELGRYIHRIFNSAQTGYEKPHPMAFEFVLRNLDGADQIWMIGDNPVADIAGAKDAGIPAILVRKDGQPLYQVLDIVN